MSSLFRWIKECFNYYILGYVKEELTAKISDNNTKISPEVKEELLKSIMLNKPTQLVDQINDEKNNIPQELKDDLMNSIMKASQQYTQKKNEKECHDDYPSTDASKSTVHYPNKQESPHIEKNWKITFNRVMAQLSLNLFIRNLTQSFHNLSEVQDSKDVIVHKRKLSLSGNYIPKKYLINCCKRQQKEKQTHNIHRKNNRYDMNIYKPYQVNNNRNCLKNKYRILKMECKWNQHY